MTDKVTCSRQVYCHFNLNFTSQLVQSNFEVLSTPAYTFLGWIAPARQQWLPSYVELGTVYVGVQGVPLRFITVYICLRVVAYFRSAS